MNKSWRNVVIGVDNVSAVSNNGSSSTNGSRNGPSNSNAPTSASSGNSGAKIPVAAENDAKRYERLLIVYAPLVSQRVTVFLYDGAVFEGTLDSFETEKAKNEFALILRMATMLQPGREVIDASIKAGITFELMNIRFDDMAELKSNSSSKTGGIGTDAAISKKKGDFGKERELHRWLPEEQSGHLPSLASNPASSNWDQFATNEKLFGLKTDFNEEMYTTKLDRSSAHVKANDAKAERIAKEIMMASAGGNAHLAEERGHEVKEGDEEMLYGAVIRERESTSTLPPGFTGDSNKSTLNPSAPEFKLNVDAPEFNPNRVTYYNQPRRNLMNMNYNNGINMNTNGYYGGVGYGYPHQVPYYYVPPSVVEHIEPETVERNETVVIASSHTRSTDNVTNDTTPAPSTTTTTAMNPNAADFVMPQPQYYQQPFYGNNGYGYGNGYNSGYNSGYNNNYNNNNNYHNQ